MSTKLTIYLLLEVIDILSGLIKALIKKEKIKSSIMAVGLYKKTGNVICLTTTYLLTRYMYDLFRVDFFTVYWTYIIAMTSLSIFENVGTDQLRKLILGGLENGNKQDRD